MVESALASPGAAEPGSAAHRRRVLVAAAVCATLWTLLLSAMLASHVVERKNPLSRSAAAPSARAPAAAPDSTARVSTPRQAAERWPSMVAAPDRQTLAEAKAHDAPPPANAAPAPPDAAPPPTPDAPAPAAQTASTEASTPVAAPSPTQTASIDPGPNPAAEPGPQITSAPAREDVPAQAPASGAAAGETTQPLQLAPAPARPARSHRTKTPAVASQARRKPGRELALPNRAPAGGEASLAGSNVDPKASAGSSPQAPRPQLSDEDSLENRRAALLGLQPRHPRLPPREPEPTLATREPTPDAPRARLEHAWEERERWLGEQLRRK